MGQRRGEYIKWAATIAAVVFAVIVIAGAVVSSRRANNAVGQGGTQESEPKQLEGWIRNAYIVSCDEDSFVVQYEGNSYELEGKLQSPYIGVADLEVEGGRVLRVNAKSASVEGTLDRYTQDQIWVSGYEELSYSGNLPVYVVEEDVFAGEKKLTDLIVGASQIRLIVAEGQACALIQYREESFENIRVLIKNQASLFYKNIYLVSDETYTVDGKKKKKNKVTSVKDAMKECKTGDKICISSTKGKLFLCDRDGAHTTEGYEGAFLVQKVDDGYVLVNEVPIETYLRYVLPSEMPVSFSYEALKAQAVCARTFAYKQMRGNAYAQYGANLDDSTSYQVYHASSAHELTDQAVFDTEGLVVTSDGELIDCYYFSTSPGYSENLEVWNAASPDYLKAENHTKEKNRDLSGEKAFHRFISETPDACDKASPYYRWTAELSAELGEDEEYGKLKKLTVNERSSSGYILSLTVTYEDGERTYDRENDIRSSLGKYVEAVTLQDGSVRERPGSVPSACFEIASQKDGTIVLRGGGFGHGIGMSQYGADGMAKEGAGWQEIIRFYYQDVEITDWRNIDEK